MPPSPDPATARQAAHAILARPEFASVHPSLYDRARTWVDHQIAHLLDHLFPNGFSILSLGLLVVLVVAIAWIAWRVRRGLVADEVVRTTATDARRLRPRDWLAEAQACEAAGDFKGALRARYRALVAELAERRLVDEVAGRTTGEYRAAVATAVPRAVADFGGVTDIFERAVYGDVDPGAVESARIAELADRVLAASR